MQIDILAKSATILRAADQSVISITAEANEIDFQIVIKSAGIEKLYTVRSEVKLIKGQPEIKTRLE